MRWIGIHLRSKASATFQVLEEIGFARVPILKLRYVPTGLDLDLSFNSVLSEFRRLAVRAPTALSPHRCRTIAWCPSLSHSPPLSACVVV